VALKDGKVVSGVKVAETETSLTLVDGQAQKHVLSRRDVEEQQKSPVSTMPEGVEKRLTEDEFADLISFLASLKEPRGR
jgi:putative heme-binding domain-containing protein